MNPNDFPSERELAEEYAALNSDTLPCGCEVADCHGALVKVPVCDTARALDEDRKVAQRRFLAGPHRRNTPAWECCRSTADRLERHFDDQIHMLDLPALDIFAGPAALVRVAFSLIGIAVAIVVYMMMNR